MRLGTSSFLAYGRPIQTGGAVGDAVQRGAALAVCCRRLAATIVVLALMSTLASPALAAPASVAAAASDAGTGSAAEGFGKRLLADLLALVTKPAHMDACDWTNLGFGALAVVGTATFDPRVRTWAQDHRSTSSDDFATSIRPLGQWGAFVVLGATWAAGKAWSKPSLTSTAEDGLEAAILAAGVVTPVLKEVVGRQRPSYGAGHATFKPFAGGASFPSGDVTLAFSVASVFAAHASSLWVKGTAWGLAGLVGWERVHLDRHWASDVVAGALIGGAVGDWVVRRHEPGSSTASRWAVLPSFGPGEVGVQLARSW
jgi:membrane-associated phospholipid phosphatase